MWIQRGGLGNSWILALALGLSAVPAAAQVSQETQATAQPLDERESYAFVRTIDGDVAVATEGQGIGANIERNQPLLTGDRIDTRDGRIEIVLPDRNRLLIGGDSAVRLDRLAYSGDRESRVTVLGIEAGELLLEVTEEALGDELPQIQHDAATIYVQEPGLYRVRAEDGWLELVAREGYAEMVTSRGSTVVRAGEAAEAGGDSWGRIEISDAGGLDTLERWGQNVERPARRSGGSVRYLDDDLDYAADDLDNAGDWVVVQGDSYWQPRVTAGWRPYWDGRWAWTPSGYTWVSYEPWGWVPYHYGRWSLLPGYGWAWRPGAVYSPAWVYWHWSSGYAGWCPTGYYTDYYNPWYGGGYRWGNYGWAGGHWGYYSHWNFAPVHCFRDRNFRGHLRRGDDMRRDGRWPEAPRGLITTDTRDFRPDRIDRPDQLLHRIREGEIKSTRGELPDVTDFVGRRRDLPADVVKAIGPGGAREPRIHLDEPKVVEAPGWRTHGGDGTKVAIGSPRGGRRIEAPVAGAHGGDKSAAPRLDDAKGTVRNGSVPDSGGSKVRVGSPRSATPVEASPRVDGGSRQGWRDKDPNGTSGSGDARTSAPRAVPKPDPGAGVDSRQRESAPVERVISGTRRSVPKPGGEGGSYRSGGTTPSSPRASEPQKPASSSPRGSGSENKPSYGAPQESPRYRSSGDGSKSGSTSSQPRSQVTPGPGKPSGVSSQVRQGGSSSSPSSSSVRSGGSGRSEGSKSSGSGSSRSSDGGSKSSSGGKSSGDSSSGSRSGSGNAQKSGSGDGKER
jgi:hypothetical protein